MNELTIAGTRPREDPRNRFRGSKHIFDLIDLNAQMLDEKHFGEHGHRQMTIFHHRATSIVLFTFEEGGSVKDHRVNGLVTIQVLEGALTVEIPDASCENDWKTSDLRAGHVLVLGAKMLHNMTAHAPSRVLMTFQLDEE